MTQSLPASYFDALYAENPDPWDFTASKYEQEKYAATLAALPHPSYASALEIGCSIGIFTRKLAPRCDTLIAVDIAAQPLAQAAAHCADLPNIAFRQMQIPQDWPDGVFDLTLISEVLYYLSPDDIAHTAAQATRTQSKDGAIVLVHWLGPTNYPTTADAAVSLFMAASGLRSTHATRTDQYRLDVLSPHRQ